ncbi:MAG: FxsA family protein [Longimicrobiales bacterium]
MLGLLILAFIALPVLELIVLMRIGSWLGLLPTLLLILTTGVVGAAVARSQGMQVLARMRGDLAEGKPPVNAVIDGVLIFAAGLLLVTPGVISDVMGILLLLPPTRALVRRLMASRMKQMIENGRAQFTIMHGGPPPPSDRAQPTQADRSQTPRGRDVTDL